jgi:uncharacterized protein (DUF58 family)
MSARAAGSFALVPKRRFAGVQLGDRRSPRRGSGDEVAGSRPYRPGDHLAWIDWASSARLSAARGSDEFVVREYFAEQAPRVALVCDRRPAMAIYAPPLPWLDKQAALSAAADLIGASVSAARGELAFADHVDGRPFWRPPATRAQADQVRRRLSATPFDAPPDALQRSFDLLVRHRGLFPAGSFVFVLSDFLTPVWSKTWVRFRSLRWDVTPVVVQDPLWEQSFPEVDGVALPLADPASGRVAEAWIGAGGARRRAAANAHRLASTLSGFRRMGFDPIVLDTSDAGAILSHFRAWAERRRRLRRART